MASLGAGLPEIAFFHLLSHAYFKALLFLGVGSCISQVSGLQDLRIGSLVRQFRPLAACVLLRCSAGLCGLPFIGGFYSKDLLIEILANARLGGGVKLLVWMSLFSTPIYSVSLMLYLFSARNNTAALQPYIDGTLPTSRALLILAPWAILGPAIVQWLVLSFKYCPRINQSQKFFILLRVMAGLLVGILIAQVKPIKYQGLMRSSLGRLLSLSMVTSRFGALFVLPLRATERSIIDQFRANLLFTSTPKKSLSNSSRFIIKKNWVIKFAILSTCGFLLATGWVYLYLPNLSGFN